MKHSIRLPIGTFNLANAKKHCHDRIKKKREVRKKKVKGGFYLATWGCTLADEQRFRGGGTMPRSKRPDEAGKIYHAVNRGNHQQDIFHKPKDFHAFLSTLREGLDKYPVDLLAICLMGNH